MNAADHATTPCTVYRDQGGAMTLAHGQLQARGDGDLDIALDPGADFPTGARVVIEYVDRAGRHRAVAQVVSAEPRRVLARVSRERGPDKREYPRVDGLLRLSWTRGELGPWLAGVPAEGAPVTPEAFMNFSVTGAQFDEAQAVEEGEVLLLELAIPGATERWRCGGSVVRAVPIPAEERESVGATHRVALQFVGLPAAAAEALLDYTLVLQDAWVSSLGGNA